MEESNRFLPPEKIKANIGIMLTQKHGNYLAAVNALRSLHVGEDNIEEVQQVMRNINSFLNSVENHRKEMKEPVLDYGRKIDAAHKEFVAEIEQEKLVIQLKLNTVAKAKAEKAAQEQAERARLAAVTDRINNFSLQNSVIIASATNNSQLLDVERLINLERGKKTIYGDQLPMLIERCNELTSKIADQKRLIREREAVAKAKAAAEQAGNDRELEKLEEKAAEIENKIEDNAIRVQETASNSLMLPVNGGDVEVLAPKARRTAWKAEISDVHVAVKKAKDLLRIELEPERIRNSINTLKAAGVFTGKEEVVVNGIRYFQTQTF